MKLSLCISGGGSRGAFALGVIAYLQEQNIEFEAYSGSSVGSILAVSTASGISPKEQLKIYKSKEAKKALKFNPYLNGLFTINKEASIVKELLPYSKLEDIPKKIYLCSYDFSKKELLYYDKGDTFELCRASCAVIPIFKPIKYDNRILYDGALVDNLPVTPLLENEYKVCSINLFPRERKKRRKTFNPIRIIKRKLFPFWHENMDYSIKNSHIYITHPSLRDISLFTFDGLDDLFDFGYSEGKKYISSLRK